MLAALTAGSPDHPSFHVVAPSLPGYGFSKATKKPGSRGPQYPEPRLPASSRGFTRNSSVGGTTSHGLTTEWKWISVHWFSRAGPGESTQIYYEMSTGNTWTMFDGSQWQSVPVGVSRFEEVVQLPKSWAHMLGKVVFVAEHDKGGHFAAFEHPEALVQDLRDMYKQGGPAYGVVMSDE
ncbi:hypothetical protein C8Q80DRAFT_379808 [Daedaleopsis nitida]|nr:hypothetical protein C8Q80DRAFT_379808 [Daedaleopsis nitida]